MYKVLLESRAERDLDSLDSQMRNRIIAQLLKMKSNPRGNAVKLTDSKNAWRIRVGDWRIIYEINDKVKELKIYRIKHRSKAY